MSSLTLDAGALIALERGNQIVRSLLRRADLSGDNVRIPGGSLAQVWRAHSRQHALHLLLSTDKVDVVPLDLRTALAIGALCATTSTHDVVDASVAHCARLHGDTVVTSDPGDITALDPDLDVVAV